MTDADVPACREILQRCFPEETMRCASSLDEFEREPWCAPSDRMVSEVDGQVVSHLAHRRGDLWMGGFAFPAIRIGAVATRPDFRGRRLASSLVDRACAEARRRGTELAVMCAREAIGGFCQGLGFARAVYSLPAWRLDLDRASDTALKRAIDAARHHEIRRAVPDEADALDELYFQHHSRMTGAWSRGGPFWRRRLAGAPAFWLGTAPEVLVTASGDQLLAYVVVTKDADRWDLLEFACVAGHEHLVAACAAKLAQEAPRAGVRWLGIDVSYADAVARELVPLGLRGNVTYEGIYLRVLDERAMSDRVREAVDLRALGAGTSGEIDITGHDILRPGTGDREFCVHLSIEDLAILMFNGASLETLTTAKRVRLEPPGAVATSLVRKLFPETHAVVSRFDPY